MVQELKRTLSLKTSIGIVVANMIGSGIFITSGLISGMLPSASWVIICWGIGGVLALLGALCYSELATRMPYAGGEYVYLNILYHPLFGFLSGWTSFIVGFSAPIAGSAIGFSEYLFAGFSLDALSDSTQIILKKITSVAIVIIFTTLHYQGIKKGSAVQNLLVIIKVLFILGIIIMGFILGDVKWENIDLRFEDYAGSEEMAIGTAMMLVMFSYSGWNASSYIASEIRNPKRNITLSLLLGTSIVIVLYLGINLFFFTSIPYEEVNQTVTIGEAASVTVFGQSAGKIISIIIALILLSSISAFTMIGPRIYYAMAKDGLFFNFAKRIHKKYEVPSRSILIQGVLAAIFVIFSSLEQLLIYLYYALNIFPILAVLGLFIARRKKIGLDNCYKVVGYPFTPLLFLMGSFYLAIIAFVNRPIESSAALITVALGIPLYFIWLKLRNDKAKSASIVDSK